MPANRQSHARPALPGLLIRVGVGRLVVEASR
jgi:hypothetical protein